MSRKPVSKVTTSLDSPAKNPTQIKFALLEIGTEKLSPDIAADLKDSGVRGITRKTTCMEAVLRNIFAEALRGKPWACQMIMDRIEDKQPIKITMDKNPTEMDEDDIDGEIAKLTSEIKARQDEIEDMDIIDGEIIHDTDKHDNGDDAAQNIETGKESETVS